MNGKVRLLLLSAAFIGGFFSPWAAHFSWLIRYIIIVLMFFSMLQMRFHRNAIRKEHWKIFAANLLIGLGGWGLFRLAGQPELAAAAFFTGITPTAASAPVIAGMLRLRVDFVVGSFLLTNIGMALLFPLLIPLVSGNSAPALFGEVVGSLAVIIGIPLLLALPVRRWYPRYRELPKRFQTHSYVLWIAMLFLIIANASNFLRKNSENLSGSTLFQIALLSLVLAVIGFSFGRLLGGRRYFREAGQSLGQKNTSVTVYLALAYASPLAALGPTFYILWHNSWNAWQLHRRDQRKKRIR